MGLLFFGGLWLTVRRGTTTKYPVFWFGGSFLLRTAVVLTGFYWIAGDRWEALLICLTGFLTGRFLVNKLPKMSGKEASIIKEKES